MNIKQKILSLVIGLSSLTLAALVAPTVQADCGGAKPLLLAVHRTIKARMQKTTPYGVSC
jgi:hypothetical protein